MQSVNIGGPPGDSASGARLTGQGHGSVALGLAVEAAEAVLEVEGGIEEQLRGMLFQVGEAGPSIVARSTPQACLAGPSVGRTLMPRMFFSGTP